MKIRIEEKRVYELEVDDLLFDAGDINSARWVSMLPYGWREKSEKRIDRTLRIIFPDAKEDS